jgi:hypothetical protein
MTPKMFQASAGGKKFRQPTRRRFMTRYWTASSSPAFTGAPATIDAKVGGALNAFGGMIAGVTVELVPDKRILRLRTDVPGKNSFMLRRLRGSRLEARTIVMQPYGSSFSPRATIRR